MSEIKAIYLKDYKKPQFMVESLDLVFELEEEFTLVTNTMQIKSVQEGIQL